MQRKLGFTLIPVTMMVLCASAGAQMVVHAVSGMVKAVNPDSKTMDVTVDDGDDEPVQAAVECEGDAGFR